MDPDLLGSGHHAIRVEIYDPDSIRPGRDTNDWILEAYFYIDNGWISDSPDHTFDPEDVPDDYIDETPPKFYNGIDLPHKRR